MQLNSNRVLQAIISGLIVLLIASNQPASANNQPAVTTIFAIVVKRIDTRSANLNQELTLRTISDVVVDGVVVIPSGSRVVGHIVELATKGKGSEQSIIAIVIDKAILENGKEITLQGIIAAVAAPPDSSLSSDPTYGMMHSTQDGWNRPQRRRAPGRVVTFRQSRVDGNSRRRTYQRRDA